jgi:sulfide:quinone oxidoreductase
MKKLLVLGAGSAGTMVANRMNRTLNRNEWEITIVDPDPVHYYQPAFLFLPFGINSEKELCEPRKKYLPGGVNYLQESVEIIEPDHNKVRLASGDVLEYDYLVIATGTGIHPEETPGLAEHEWGKSIHTFYDFEGAVALTEKMRDWEGGRMVVNVVETPIKCPVAPLEFLLLADWYYTKRGMRDRVELVYATPLSGAFTKPIASKILGDMLEKRNILVEPDYMIERADPDAKKIVSYDEREVEYDLLVSVPLNMGADMVAKSGLGDELNYSPVDKHTFLSDKFDNIFVLGDASNAPTSKAGSVAHFAIDLWGENFVDYVEGKEMTHLFDGHANCFIESGFSKGFLIDFNYDVEPLPGAYPLPVVGPFALLKESWLNHVGKLAFRHIYWNILMRGYGFPLPANMQMTGKRVPQGTTYS